jgi:hypothetical protein
MDKRIWSTIKGSSYEHRFFLFKLNTIFLEEHTFSLIGKIISSPSFRPRNDRLLIPALKLVELLKNSNSPAEFKEGLLPTKDYNDEKPMIEITNFIPGRRFQ